MASKNSDVTSLWFSQLTVPPVLTPLFTPAQKLIYPFTTPLIILLSTGTFFDQGEIIGFGNVPYWLLWLASGLTCFIILIVFYNDGKYKGTPRMVHDDLLVLFDIDSDRQSSLDEHSYHTDDQLYYYSGADHWPLWCVTRVHDTGNRKFLSW